MGADWSSAGHMTVLNVCTETSGDSTTRAVKYNQSEFYWEKFIFLNKIQTFVLLLNLSAVKLVSVVCVLGDEVWRAWIHEVCHIKDNVKI